MINKLLSRTIQIEVGAIIEEIFWHGAHEARNKVSYGNLKRQKIKNSKEKDFRYIQHTEYWWLCPLLISIEYNVHFFTIGKKYVLNLDLKTQHGILKNDIIGNGTHAWPSQQILSPAPPIPIPVPASGTVFLWHKSNLQQRSYCSLSFGETFARKHL